MYGDTGVMRRRAAQLREQGDEIRLRAHHLVSQMERIPWAGRAAEAMRERIRERASHLRDVADLHETAATSLELHLHQVVSLKEQIASVQRRTETVTAEHRGPTSFAPPPSGHKDWLDVDVPGR